MGRLSDIKADLGEDWDRFEAILAEAIESDNQLLNKINSYLLDNSGKKLRPLLVLLSAKAGSGFINELSIVCAAVSELIHTATLLHDDVVDDSDLRRGSLTVKSLFSPGASVLMGDYWLSKAIHLLISNNCDYEIMRGYSQTIEDLASGEMLQMERAEDLKTTHSDYIEIITRKTASLFVSSVRSGAIASGASAEAISALTKYALHFGICFQIRDDILDYSSSSKTGKDSDSDISERKITLPLLCALDSAPDKRNYILSRMSEIDVSDKDSLKNVSIIKEVKRFVTDHSGVSSARNILQNYISEAISDISSLPDTPAREALTDIARIVGR